MKIILAPCSYRYLEKYTAWSIGKLLACPEPKFYQTAASPDAAIDRARSMIASEFLRSDYDALLFIDDDIFFQPPDAVKLAQMILDGKQVVGATYVSKSQHPKITCRLFNEQNIVFNGNTKPVKVKYLSAGFMMIGRKVLERLSEKLPYCYGRTKIYTPFWPFFMPMVKRTKLLGGEYDYLSEDYAFCERANDSGFDCWLDPSIRLTHIGPYQYDLEDMARFKEEKRQSDSIMVYSN